MSKFLQAFQRFLIYSLVIFIGFAGLLLLSAQKTSASSGSVEKSKQGKINFESPICLNKDNVYYLGQRIECSFSFGNIESAWAQIGGLDSSFPDTINLSQNNSGVWQLRSPSFTPAMNIGPHLITVFVSDQGRIFEQNFKVILKETSSVASLSAILIKEETITIGWKNIGLSDNFLINWQSEAGQALGSAIVSGQVNTFQIKNLKPGTNYKVTIWPLYAGQKGTPARGNFKTLVSASSATLAKKTTVSPTQSSAVAPSPTAVQPTIGEGASTFRRVSAGQSVKAATSTKPATVESKTPQVSSSPSPTPAAEEKTGASNDWSKLLVALSILIIAAAAAIGGYYGYEWLMSRSKENDDDEPPAKSSDRW